jgi:hypothetical protein
MKHFNALNYVKKAKYLGMSEDLATNKVIGVITFIIAAATFLIKLH